MTLQKKDFIEIEFTGRIKDGEIFDSNIKEDLKNANIDANSTQLAKAKPFIFCLGEEMFLKGIDDFLIGKNIGEYGIELQPEKAFGKRDPSLIKMIPMKIFVQQKVNPVPGAMFNFDGRIAKILTVSGGRIMVDFNNLLAGKTVVYKIKLLRKVEDINEKIKSFNDFLFKKDLKFEIKNKTLYLEIEKPLIQFAEMFKDKFKDLFDLELNIKVIEKKTTQKPPIVNKDQKTPKKSQ